jgi:hypothetical protein
LRKGVMVRLRRVKRKFDTSGGNSSYSTEGRENLQGAAHSVSESLS